MPTRLRRYLYVCVLAFPFVGSVFASEDCRSGLAPLIFMDGHVHLMHRVYVEGIDPWKVQEVGPFDYARAKASGVNVVIENLSTNSYTPYDHSVKQSLRLIETFLRTVEANPDKMGLALTAADVRHIVSCGKLAVILGIEGGWDQEGDIDVLRAFYRLGVRLIQFSSQRTNAYADAGTDTVRKWNGINERGVALVREMNRLGILIDISHASEEAQLQIIAASRAPVVASHVGLSDFCVCGDMDGVMISDRVLKALAAKGGVAGLHGDPVRFGAEYASWQSTHPSPATAAFLPRTAGSKRWVPPQSPYRPGVLSPDADYGQWINQLDAEQKRNAPKVPWKEDPAAAPLVPGVDAWAAEARHAIGVVGADHVAIGLDLFWGHPVMKDFDASRYARLLEALGKVASPQEVRLIAGENWLRVLDAARIH